MPVHDWTRVEAGIFHDFHGSWITHLKESLNEGLLPSGYYALGERQGQGSPFSVRLSPNERRIQCPVQVARRASYLTPGQPGAKRGAEFPRSILNAFRKQPAQRRIAIRHVSNHCVVALIEIVSPGNKDRAENVDDFVRKARQALEQGCHLLVIDLFPPGRHDPLGMHGAIWKKLGRDKVPPPAGLPLGLAAYLAKTPPEAYLEWVGVGSALPEMPLFLDPSRYVNAPLDATYEAAWRGVPRVWRDVLEKPAVSGGKLSSS